MHYNFDEVIDRRHSDSEKWRRYGDDVLPLWVADMDFRSPDVVVEAIQQRLDHGVFGYMHDPIEMREVIVERLQTRYGWHVAPEAVILLPGVQPGFNVTCNAFAAAGDGVLIQTPIYPPILHAHSHFAQASVEAPLTRDAAGHYSIDLEAFERAITERTRVFLLCNPHNPTGRVFRRDELAAMAEICLRHDLIVCSDEIHCDIVYPGHQHLPLASLAPEIADKTITLMAPSKTFNMPGLRLAIAVIPNATVRRCFQLVQRPLIGSPNTLGVVAARAAYQKGQPWLDDLLAYLEANCDYLLHYVQANMPAITVHKPEATYLAWLDCRQAGIAGRPFEFFLQKANVALNGGESFGSGGEGFVRVNFGCPRSTLAEALDRMRAALATI